MSDVPNPARSPDGASSRLGWIFAGAVLLSAFLLFQVQPLVSKCILPWFGGGPAVWTTCMLFFQVALCAGYAYAHASQQWLSPRLQGMVHAGLLLGALLALPILPSATWKPLDSEQPVARILALLAVCVGAPYLTLSATGPLLQAWFARACPGRSPYRLYALSNLGSLAALVTYPVVFEPALDLGRQASIWSAAFAIFAVLCALAAWGAARAAVTSRVVAEIEPGEVGGLLPAMPAVAEHSASLDAEPGAARRVRWLLLPACASLMLLATTNHLCEDIPPMPFLWVAPLALYLITFIVAFDHERWYSPRWVGPLAAAALLLAAGVGPLEHVLDSHFHIALNYIAELAIDCAAMFGIAMVCHGELVRSRPAPRHLTEFYMLISAGGALGGVIVSLVAPRIFHTFFEWRLGLLIGFVLALVVGLKPIVESVGRARQWPRRRGAAALGALALLGATPICAWQIVPLYENPPLARLRNFYGVVSVEDRELDAEETAAFFAAEKLAAERLAALGGPATDHAFSSTAKVENPAEPADRPRPTTLAYRQLRNGHVVHGRQFLDPALSLRPNSYYTPATGVGQAMLYFQDRDDLRVGVVGLGIGTLAAYARPGSYFRFYEINPNVLAMAETYFTYLRDCAGRHDVSLGDARLSLDQEQSWQFHVLVLDAFSGDSIPTHLLTREAFEIYMKHLAPDGVLVIHITNSYIDLAPVVAELAEHFHLGSTRAITRDEEERLVFRTDWVTLTRSAAYLESHPSHPADLPPPRRMRLWTDDYSNLFEILK